MSQDYESLNGPSPHCVALARTWLRVLGAVWLLAGLIAGAASYPGLDWVPFLLAVVGLGHLVAARFASHRVAVFLTMFAP